MKGGNLLIFIEIEKEIPIKGEWKISFPEGYGAPKEIILPELISLSEHSNDGVRFFSGSFVYEKEFEIPEELFDKNKRYFLDLGRVEIIAKITLNGKYIGTLWKIPYCIDISDGIRIGKNILQIKVTNLWVNRLIGDENLPEDSERTPIGTLKSWPEWLLEGKKSPTGRITFTTWKHWGKSDNLPASGILGPVKLQIVK